MGEEECSIGLGLGIGRGDFVSSRRDRERKPPPQFHILFPNPRKEEEKEEERQITEQIKTARTRRNNREENTASGDTGDGYDIDGGTRKKLRLTKEQSIQLEDSFRKRNTLNSTQKQNLAEKLSLTPRQIEVWFQNRRARTKLKKTEVDCELLKKCCESLSDENQRLRKELQELRAFNSCPSSSSLYVQIHKAATLTMCPSCNRISAKDGCNSSSMAC